MTLETLLTFLCVEGGLKGAHTHTHTLESFIEKQLGDSQSGKR